MTETDQPGIWRAPVNRPELDAPRPPMPDVESCHSNLPEIAIRASDTRASADSHLPALVRPAKYGGLDARYFDQGGTTPFVRA